MTDAKMVAEVATAAAETVAPVVVKDGTLDWKKVAFVAGGILVVAGGAYCAKKMIDKRKANKALIESATKTEDVPVANVIPEEVK